jgi:hypothetical protein
VRATSEPGEREPATIIDAMVKQRGLGTAALLLCVQPLIPTVGGDQDAALGARRERPPQL